MAAAPRSNALRVALAVAAGAGVAAAVPRTASACSCIARGAYLQSPRPGGASSAALPLLIAAPTDADIHLEDEAGRALASRGVLFLPTLGLCNMPWFLVGPDGGPWPPGTYRLVRGPDNADTFQLTATGVAAVPATLSMTLSIETIDPITPDGAGCWDQQFEERPFTRLGTLSLELDAAADAAPMVATVLWSDPATPDGFADSTWIRPRDPNGPRRFLLPLYDAADSCATVWVWDGTGGVQFTGTLCAAAGPERRAVEVDALVPGATTTTITPKDAFVPGGCAVAGAGGGAPRSVAILSAALAFVGIWRSRRAPGRILRAWRPRRPGRSTRTG